MSASLLLRLRHALHAMYAALILQSGIHFLSLNGGDDFLQAAERRRRAFEHFHVPSLRLGVARIHAEKLAGKKRGLVSASPGANLEQYVLLVVRVLGKKQQLELPLDRFL